MCPHPTHPTHPPPPPTHPPTHPITHPYVRCMLQTLSAFNSAPLPSPNPQLLASASCSVAAAAAAATRVCVCFHHPPIFFHDINVLSRKKRCLQHREVVDTPLPPPLPLPPRTFPIHPSTHQRIATYVTTFPAISRLIQTEHSFSQFLPFLRQNTFPPHSFSRESLLSPSPPPLSKQITIKKIQAQHKKTTQST